MNHEPHISLFEQKVQAFIEENSLLNPGAHVLVALSGGADSVALLRMLLALGYRCEAAHCNFHLRGEESNRDEEFVSRLCHALHIPLHIHHFDVPAYMDAHGVSMEMACRDLRYDWFRQLVASLSCDALAVAHHQNDDVETFFLNALRASGIAGLSGMPLKNGIVVRPLLCLNRAEVLEYLKDKHQDFVTDSTNQKNEVKRNKLRNVVLPSLEEQFPGALRQIHTTISHLRSCHSLYAEMIEHIQNECCHHEQDALMIDYKALFRFANSTTLLFEILKPYGFNHSQCADILQTAAGGNGIGKHFYSSSFTLTINRLQLQVFINKAILQSSYAIKLNNREIQIPIHLNIQRVNHSEFDLKQCDGKQVIALNTAALNAKNAVIRKWKHADRFQPFGMKGSKLVSDLFTDLKLNEKQKSDTWILEADSKILWVMGCRASNHYRVSPADSTFLVLSIRK
ncbi:MAG: tRNA lysidine(34) synthetase TilS [Sodaliphilus sp.]